MCLWKVSTNMGFKCAKRRPVLNVKQCIESSVHRLHNILSIFAFNGWLSWEKAIWWVEQSIWAQRRNLGRYRDPTPSPAKGWEVLSWKNAAKFGPYIELWVNIPSLCGSHLGKMDPLASPNYAWQGRQGGKLKMWELYQVPKVFSLIGECSLGRRGVENPFATDIQLIFMHLVRRNKEGGGKIYIYSTETLSPLLLSQWYGFQ